jgi:hypothetical protein
MKEAFFILLVIFLLAALTAFKYRRALTGAGTIWRSFKELNARPPVNQVSKANTENTLVRCARCGVWTPQDRSIKLAGVSYCSKLCLESKASAA